MTCLLDGNLLVAMVVADHVHHGTANEWFGRSRAFATCPITQGTLLRLLIREGATVGDARACSDGWSVIPTIASGPTISRTTPSTWPGWSGTAR